MSDLVAALVRRLVPGSIDINPATARLSISVDGVHHPVRAIGLGKTMLQIHRSSPLLAPPVGTAGLVLHVDLNGGAIRLDTPVEVIACGRTTLLLRVLGAPLVLRRRVVHHRALADAVGAPQAISA